MPRFALTLSLSLLLPLAAAEPDWFVRAWQTEDGLLNNDVTGIAQEPGGAMLFATRGGLSRFDGCRFTEIAKDTPGYTGRSVTAVLPAQDGSLWMVTRGSLVRQVRGMPDERLDMPGANVTGSRETAFFEDSQGVAWLCFERGRFHRIANGRAEQVAVAPGLSPTFASCATLDANGQVWAAGPHVLACWHEGRFEQVASLPKDRSVICSAATEGIWIGAGRKIFRASPAGEVSEKGDLATAPSGARITALLEDRHRRLWAGTFGGGLWLQTDGQFHPVALPNPDVWWLHEDREGNVWAATGGGGICRIRPRVISLLDEPGGPGGQIARSVCLDSQGDLWVAVQNGSQLFVRRGGTWKSLAPGIDWPATKAIRLNAGSNGRVWIGTGEGNLVRWDGHAFELIPLPPDGVDPVICSILEASTGELWVGRSYSLWRGRPGEWQPVVMPAESGEVRALAQDAAGQIWAGTNRGLLLRENAGVMERTAAAELGPACTRIHAMAAASDGSLLIGTEGAGLARITAGRCERVMQENGLPSNVVSQLAFDLQGRVWAGGETGIFMVPFEQLANGAAGRAKLVLASSFGRSEGITGLQANASFPGAARTSDGRLWFSTRRGIVICDPDLVGKSRVAPPLAIEGVVVNGSRATDPARIGPGVLRVQFDLSAPSFTAPEQVRLYHRLTGLDGDWIPTPPERQASYTNVPPGNYRLRVRAANNDGVWSETEASLAFRVIPHWWQSLGFRLLTLAASLAAVVWIANWLANWRALRQAEALRREAVLNEERARISRDMHDQVGASLTQIKLLAELSSDGSPAASDLAKIATAAHQAVDELDALVWAVSPHHDNLASLADYLAQEAVKLTAPAGIRCRLHLPEQVPPLPLSAEQRRHVFLIVREALHNAVKHSNATEVSLRLHLDDDLLIDIQDDGRGLDEGSAQGHGLANMRERAAQLNGCCTVQSHGQRGTLVQIRLPWRVSDAHHHLS